MERTRLFCENAGNCFTVEAKRPPGFSYSRNSSAVHVLEILISVRI